MSPGDPDGDQGSGSNGPDDRFATPQPGTRNKFFIDDGVIAPYQPTRRDDIYMAIQVCGIQAMPNRCAP